MMEAFTDISRQIELEHLLFKERKCKTCGQEKNLLEDFYMTRKDRGAIPSAFSYECKVCTITRVTKNKRRPRPLPPYLADYPDW